MTVARAKESDCQATIVAAAMRAGWRVHAQRTALTQSGRYATAIQGHKGWPDLVMVRGTELLVVELKRKPNRLEPEQVEWHAALSAAGVTVETWWVPEELDACVVRLMERKAA